MTIEDKLDRIIELLEGLPTGTGSVAADATDAEEADAEGDEAEVAPAAPKRGRGRPPKDPTPTLDDARVVGKAYVDKKGTAAMKDLLAKFKVKKLGDMDESLYAKFIKAANAGLDAEAEGDEDGDEELV